MRQPPPRPAAPPELQYVRIYTTRGDALVLGALRDSLRIVLTLSNGLEVPVSRRRQAALIRQFGSSRTLR